jgi:DNA polymerase elongation subunit (family B)
MERPYFISLNPICFYRPAIALNAKRQAVDDYLVSEGASYGAGLNPLDNITDMREFDVPYSMRVSIYLDMRVGAWLEVFHEAGSVNF